MSFYNQPGKWACKNEYKDMQCRIMFPQCTDVGGVGSTMAPCRSKCLDFLSRCPGADIGCDDLSGDPKECYNFEYQSGSVVGDQAATLRMAITCNNVGCSWRTGSPCIFCWQDESLKKEIERWDDVSVSEGALSDTHRRKQSTRTGKKEKKYFPALLCLPSKNFTTNRGENKKINLIEI